MIDELTTDEPSLSSKASPGMILSAARNELNWTIEDVAANLNLRVRVIQALENDDYSDLPGTTFVRGYIRAYARLLGVDESEVIDDETIVVPQPRSYSSRSPMMRAPAAYRPGRERGGKSWLLWVALLALIVMAWSFSGIRLWGPDGLLASMGIGGSQLDSSEISLPLDPDSRVGTSSD
jgi:cytoskeleton protein RodZ